MSVPILILAILDLAAAILLTLRLRKGEGVSLEDYRDSLRRAFRGEWGRRGFPSLIHYLTLHLLTPLWGLGFFLRSDINFLMLILAVIASIQIVQRLYPGYGPEEHGEENSP